MHAFVADVGFPLILKPRTGRARSTRCGSTTPAELDAALGRFGGQGVESIAVEEFVEGHEGFYDTVSIDGHTSQVNWPDTLLPKCLGGNDSLDVHNSVDNGMNLATSCPGAPAQHIDSTLGMSSTME